MVKQTFEAVFENGVFRPLTSFKVPIPEGQQVWLVMEAPESPQEILELAAQVYEGLSERQIDEIEQIILDRQDFFSDRT